MIIEMKNTQNGYQEKIDSRIAFIMTLLFGPLYFFSKSLYGWAIITSFVSSLMPLFYFSNVSMLFIIIGIHMVISVFSGEIIAKQYQRLGWIVTKTKKEK